MCMSVDYQHVWAYMFLGDEPAVTNVDNLSIMIDGCHSNGIFTNFRGNVFLNFEAKLFQHQVTWKVPNTHVQSSCELVTDKEILTRLKKDCINVRSLWSP